MEYKNWLAQKFKEIFDLVAARRDKYNGNSEDDFLQIRSAAEQTGIDTETAIRFMMNMKISRINVGSEAADDSMEDSAKDLVGYTMLWLRFREAEAEGQQLLKEQLDQTDSLPELEAPKGGFKESFKSFLGVGNG